MASSSFLVGLAFSALAAPIIAIRRTEVARAKWTSFLPGADLCGTTLVIEYSGSTSALAEGPAGGVSEVSGTIVYEPGEWEDKLIMVKQLIGGGTQTYNAKCAEGKLDVELSEDVEPNLWTQILGTDRWIYNMIVRDSIVHDGETLTLHLPVGADGGGEEARRVELKTGAVRYFVQEPTEETVELYDIPWIDATEAVGGESDEQQLSEIQLHATEGDSAPGSDDDLSGFVGGAPAGCYCCMKSYVFTNPFKSKEARNFCMVTWCNIGNGWECTRKKASNFAKSAFLANLFTLGLGQEIACAATCVVRTHAYPAYSHSYSKVI